MTIETFAPTKIQQQRNGLANIGIAQLKHMRNKGLQACFNRIDEMRFHREFVARIHGKTFINDAASRTPNATWYTLESSEGPIIWIANANSDTQDLSKMVQAANSKVQMIIGVGPNMAPIEKAFSGIVPRIIHTDSLNSAVNKALYNDLGEANVIFSPAAECLVNATVQGEEFNYAVNEL